MALVQCPECASQVSDRATACPKCGYPLAVVQKPGTPVAPKTMAAAQTGSFWLCPSCGKHVPTRQESCACGFARPQGVAVPVANPRPAVTLTPRFHEPERETPWKAIATLCVGGLVLAGAFKISMNAAQQPDPKDSKLASLLRQPSPEPAQQGYFLPGPAALLSGQQTVTQPGPPQPREPTQVQIVMVPAAAPTATAAQGVIKAQMTREQEGSLAFEATMTFSRRRPTRRTWLGSAIAPAVTRT